MSDRLINIWHDVSLLLSGIGLWFCLSLTVLWVYVKVRERFFQ